jgi:hypothetical protein
MLRQAGTPEGKIRAVVSNSALKRSSAYTWASHAFPWSKGADQG